ncbi:MAG TPA: hypothetical protein VH351_12605 [Bryobacteraceae bacterium]|nr:hypothetical protein [Bryobacteraceae bacterium]
MSHKHEQHSEHVVTDPHAGHGGTSYEGTDASVKIVLGSLAIIAITLVITALLTFPIQNVLKVANPPGNLPSPLAPERVIPPAPLLEVHPWDTLPKLRAHEDELLNGGKDQKGQVHIPITRAMDQVVSQLKIRPESPPGLTNSGGYGQDYSGSVKMVPPGYQGPQPTIQGEIRKNAQK